MGKDLLENQKNTTTEQTLESLQAAKREAERIAAANQIQTEFIANISHDLRTPLNGIIGMAERLRRINVDPECTETIECIVQGGHMLLSLVEDILNVAKLGAGKLEINHAPFDLRDLIEGAMASVTFTAQEKNVALVIEYENDVPHHLIGDHNRIKRVIMNLLGNGVKFTDRGHVKVHVKELNREGDQIKLQITIEDTGVGIPKAVQSKIFERFETVDQASYKTNKTGAGLGLTITKAFVEELGGKIWVESEENVGTQFIFEITLRVQPAKIAPTRWESEHPEIKILLVSDNPQLTEKIVHELGAEQVVTMMADQAVQLLGENRAQAIFQMILFDEAINEGKVFEFCQRFNQNHRFLHTLKIQIGAKSQTAVQAEFSTGHGFFASINTQGENGTFQDHLFEMFSKWTAHQEKQRGFLQRLNAKVLLVEDNLLNQKVVSILLKDFGCNVRTASQGAQAIEMVKEAHYDLLFLDLGLPDMDGISVAKKIRALEKKMPEPQTGLKRSFRFGRSKIRQREQPLPIIALTGHVTQEDKEACLAAGMDWFLTKPISADVLTVCLTRFLLKDEQRYKISLST